MKKTIAYCYQPKYDERIKLIIQINYDFYNASYWLLSAVNSILVSLPNELLYVIDKERYTMRALNYKDKLIYLIKFIEERIGEKY